MNFLKKIVAMFSLLAFVFPSIMVIDYVSPWEESRRLLQSEYEGELFFLMEFVNAETQKLPSGEVFEGRKKRTYLLLPSNKTIQIEKNGNETATATIVENKTFNVVALNLGLILFFVFVGLPIFRDWNSGKLKNELPG